MRLYLAEKPSLARALADVLPRPHKKGDGCIHLANGDVVTWCVGHLLELAEPEKYDAAYKQWTLHHLPISPQAWKWVAKTKTHAQLRIVQALVKSADDIVHVGDPDREGQLLIDEVLSYCKLPAARLASVKRCLVNDLNPSAVAQAVVNLRQNKEFRSLSTAALARLRADWIYGINLTRACTLLGRQAGYGGLLSVGRVQTPILGLIVRRDLDIEQFVAKPFFELFALLKTEKGECFQAKWSPSQACLEYADEQGRILSRKLVENVAKRIQGQPGVVEKNHVQVKQIAAPLPFNLSCLQVEAAKLFGMSAKQVLDLCQSLYERYKLITYPRSDCRYLPESHHSQAAAVLAAVTHAVPSLSSLVDQADTALRSKTWNDKNVSAHHAIIPTLKSSVSGLTESEKKLYGLIARYYLMQFLPKSEVQEHQIDVNIGGGVFIAKRKTILVEGWRLADLHVKFSDEESAPPLPTLRRGDGVRCTACDIKDKLTSPPKAFTDASLMAALTGIGRFVQEPDLRKILRDTDGLGTEATRASIIELLFQRGYLQREGKIIRATDLARRFIEGLPPSITLPDRTAVWEKRLADIQEQRYSYGEFMAGLLADLDELLSSVKEQKFNGVSLEGFAAKPAKKGRSKEGRTRRSRVKKAVG